MGAACLMFIAIILQVDGGFRRVDYQAEVISVDRCEAAKDAVGAQILDLPDVVAVFIKCEPLDEDA